MIKNKEYSWISPAVNTNDVGRAMEFYKKAFGFETGEQVRNKDGVMVWGRCAYKDISIMVGMPENPEGHSVPGNMPLSMYVYHENPDAVAEAAKAAGGKVLVEPADMFWGDRMTSIQDLDGFVWNFAKTIGEFDPTKAPEGWA